MRGGGLLCLVPCPAVQLGVTTMQSKPLPSQDILLSRYSYSPVTGEVWGKRKGLLNSFDRDGYNRAKVNQSTYKLHRLIWMMVTGEDPGEFEIDHIDRDPANNAWHNLRLVTRQENVLNSDVVKRNA